MRAHRTLRRVTLATLLAAALFSTPHPAHAANEAAQAWLTWSPTGIVSDLPTPGSGFSLYVRLEGADSFKGAEIDLVWTPVGSATCLAHTATAYPTATDCTYLNRGGAVDLVTEDVPGHVHVAWANPTAETGCASGGTIIEIQFESGTCPPFAACFSLYSVLVADEASNVTTAAIAGRDATILGGTSFCGNRVPSIDSLADRTAYIGEMMAVQAVASDPDGEALSYGLSNAPDGAVIDAASGLLTWVPQAGQQGLHTNITVTVFDPFGHTASATFDVEVPNRPPTADPIPDQVTIVGNPLVFTVPASDPDDDPLLYTSSDLPDGATLGSSTGLFSWTPAPNQRNTWAVHFTIADGHSAFATTDVMIQVYGSRPPVIDDVPPQTVAEGDSVAFTVTASDPDSGNLSFRAENMPDGATFAGETFGWRPTIVQAGDYFVRLIVTDETGESDTTTAHVTVTQQAGLFYVDARSACRDCDGFSWKTARHAINEALADARAGDSVLVAEGHYTEPVLTLPGAATLVGGYPRGGGKRDFSSHPVTVHPLDPEQFALLRVPEPLSVADGFKLTDLRYADRCIDVWGEGVVLRRLTISMNTFDEGFPLLRFLNSAVGCLLDRCVIVRNRVGTPKALIEVITGASLDVVDCTIASDTSAGSYGVPAIAAEGHVNVVNTIVWGLYPEPHPVFAGDVDVRYCVIDGGWSGQGNIDERPLFCDPLHGVFSVALGSPCVGAGEGGTTIGALDVGCLGTEPPNPKFDADDVSSPDPGADATDGSAPLAVSSALGGRAATISFGLAVPGPVRLEVFDPRGTRVAVLANGDYGPGRHVLGWDRRLASGRIAPAGLYVVRLLSGGSRTTARILLLP